jgi:DNA-binding transcriptional MocR family regulator
MKENVIKFTRGVPPVESFATAKLAECAAAALAEYGSVIQQYGPAIGFKPLREWIAAENKVTVDRVIVGQGSLQLLDLVAHLVVSPGEPVYVESPSYDRTLTILRRARAQLCGFTLGPDGVDVDEIERRLAGGEHPRFIYLIPDFQNPSGSVLSAEKRLAIARLAQQYDFWVVEDAPYRALRYRGEELPSIYSLIPERTLLMSSFSKTICPGLRVGYMVAPQELVGPLAKMAEDTYINSSYITQAMVFEFLRRGWLDSNLVELKRLYRQRVDGMLACLDEHMSALATWTHPEGGFFIGLTLNHNRSIVRLMEEAQKAGLELTDGRGFFPEGGGENFVRLPFCGLSLPEIEQGIKILAQAALAAA